MKERRESLLPIPYGWKPETLAREIEAEAEKWWNEGWVFARAETDRLLESVCLYFEREVNPRAGLGRKGDSAGKPVPPGKTYLGRSDLA